MARMVSLAVAVVVLVGLSSTPLTKAQQVSFGSCLISPTAPGYVLPFDTTYGGEYGMCKPGWYCPNSVLSNRSTWPTICPPTDECLAQRLERHFCEAQGLFEPVPCPAGWYCPNASTKIRCPDGYACILGSTQPRKCGPLSICRGGAANEYEMSGILVVILLDIAVIALYFVYGKWTSAPSVFSFESTVADINMRSPSPGNGFRAPVAAPEISQTLFDMYRRARGSAAPLTFDCRDLSVAIPSKRKEEPDKTLLLGATGSFRPGRVTAIMGPSGAGKTVFLTAVLGKLDPNWKTAGRLTVNRSFTATQVRSVVGVVPQDDVLHSELTVEENVYFSNETRLPASWSADDRKALRDAVITALGLDGVRQVRVGDENSKGISGGQRKRCSIALELASAPTALFLDEPTTGLDASTALDLCNLLKQLAVGADLTVGMVIHQPRFEIWDALDQVLILAPGGRTVFQGPQKQAQPYFESVLGLDFTVGNPADIILDGVAQYAEIAVAQWQERLAQEEQSLVARQLSDAPSYPEATNQVPPQRDGAGFLRQVFLAHNRSLMKQYARPHTLLMDVFLGMIASTLMGSAAIRDSYVGIVRDEYVLLGPRQKIFLVPMMAMFYHLSIASSVAAAGIRTFGLEQQQYWREASSGHNRLAYFLGYTVADFYRLILSSLHFSLIAYLMWEPIQSFGSFFLVLFLIFLCVDSQSAMLSMILRPDEAPLLATVIAVFTSLLNGYPGIPFVGPASYAWWSTEAILDANVSPLADVYQSVPFSDEWGYKLGQYGLDLGICVLIFFLYRVIAFVLMLLTNREKQR